MSYDRLIGFFDLLGFRNLVLSTSIEEMVGRFGRVYTSIGAAAVRHEASSGMSPLEIADRFANLEHTDLPGIRREFERATGLTLLLMSDSLVVFSRPCETSHPEFERLLSAMIRVSRTIMVKLFEFNLPARGAIAFGEFYADVDNSIYVGKALVEAYEAAESQEWIGAVVADSLSDEVARLEAAFSDQRLRQSLWLARPRWDYLQFDVPFKAGRRRAFVVNWGSAWNFGGPVRDDLFDDVKTGDARVDVKYSNTLAFLKQWSQLS